MNEISSTASRPASSADHGQPTRFRARAPHALIDIPATEAGFAAAEDALCAGASVNLTGVYSPRQVGAARAAHRRALARRIAANLPVDRTTCAASMPLAAITIKLHSPSQRGRCAGYNIDIPGAFMKLKQLSITIAALCVVASASAADPKLGIVYDAGGKFDKSFNQSAFEGANRFKTETKINYIEAQASSDTQAEQVLRGLARKKLDLIAAIGFSQTQAVQKVAAEFPNVKFVLIDSIAKGPNINSVLFKEEEGSYLVGVAASMASKSKKLGFVGGMDIPLIRAFACGYSQGAKANNPKVEVLQNMVGTTSAAWNDPAKGGELARAQFDRGVDVVFAVAGGSGMGTLQTAKEKGKLAIGVDSNQNYLHPGTMLTSMVKRVDGAIYDSFMAVKNGTWKPGVTYRGLKEGGVDWALDKDNRKVVSPEIEKKVNEAKAGIISGKIKVIDYRAGSSCPV